jgi:SAM-dependent methyltransferase
MPRPGELVYYDAIGEEGRAHALGKPFTDDDCGLNLMQVGGILSLLPPRPARVLECGCGTGWLSYLMCKSGYDVVGADVAPGAIDLARANPVFRGFGAPDFVVADSENLPFANEFDAVVFVGSLHHSLDEQAAVSSAYRALKSGGRLIASETGPHHADHSAEVSQRFDVTDKDMPPKLILKLGKKAGFRKRRVYLRPDEFGRYLFTPARPGDPFKTRLMRAWPFRWFAQLRLGFKLANSGLVVMEK